MKKIILTAFALLVGIVAIAQTDCRTGAMQNFEQGKAAYGQGQFKKAVEYFNAAASCPTLSKSERDVISEWANKSNKAANRNRKSIKATEPVAGIFPEATAQSEAVSVVGSVNIGTRTMASDDDIETNIPIVGISNSDVHVMIIANQKYKKEKEVATALNDGRLMKEYCIRTLGIPASQVKLLENQTMSEMESDVEDFAKTIHYNKGDRFLFFYFGHGMHSQDANSSDAYLLPIDGNSERLGRSGVGRNWMMKKFEDEKPSQMVVYLESCFSGATSDNGMLDYSKHSSGVRIKDVIDDSFKGNIILLTASSQSQTANALEKHNVFTYVFLRELQHSKGKITMGALFDKVAQETGRKAWNSLEREQQPSVTPSSTIGNGWREWKLINY